jgi:hypothetical protein
VRRANRLDYEEPTLDPVELERLRMAEDKAQAEAVRRARTWSIPPLLAIAVSVLSVAVYVAVWAGNIGGLGGPEGYVVSTPFISSLTGAQIVHRKEGPLLYDPAVQRITQTQLRGSSADLNTRFVPYDRPPFEALLLSPLMVLPSWLTFAFWTLTAGGFAIGLAVGLMDGALPVSRRTGWVLSLAVCSFFPVIRTLMAGGNSTLALMGLCGTYMALKSGSEVLAAGSLLLVAAKPQMLPAFLLVLLLQRRFATLSLFLIFIATLMVAVMPVVGVSWPADYLRFLSGPDVWGGPNVPPMQNWRGFANVLLGEAAPALIGPLFLLLSLGTLALPVWAWWRSSTNSRAETDDEKDENGSSRYEPNGDLLWALAGIVAVLIAVYSTPLDLTLLAFPAWIIGAYSAHAGWVPGTANLWTAFLWVGYALAPLTLYSANATVAVLPMVGLLAVVAVLVARMLAYGPPRAAGYQSMV